MAEGDRESGFRTRTDGGMVESSLMGYVVLLNNKDDGTTLASTGKYTSLLPRITPSQPSNDHPDRPNPFPSSGFVSCFHILLDTLKEGFPEAPFPFLPSHPPI